MVAYLVAAALSFTVLNYWALESKLRNRSFSLKFKELFTKSFIILALIYTSSNAYNNSLGMEQYSYRYGNYMPHLSIFTRNPVGQKILEIAYNLLPSRTRQYALMVADESVKAFEIKAKLSHDLLCKGENNYQCFEQAYRIINERAPMTVTGNILMVAVGALIAFKEKEQRTQEAMTSYNENLKEQILIDSALRISEVTLQAQNSLLKGGNIRTIWNNFPIQKPDALASAQPEEFLKSLSKNQAEMLLLENVENQIIRKFFKTSGQKLSKILASLDKQNFCQGSCKEQVKSYLELLEHNQQQCDRLVTSFEVDYQKHFPLAGRFVSSAMDDLSKN